MDTEARIRADWAGLVVIRDVIRPVTLSPAFTLCIVATCLCSSSAPPPCRRPECVLSIVELSFHLCLPLSLLNVHACIRSLRPFFSVPPLSCCGLCWISYFGWITRRPDFIPLYAAAFVVRVEWVLRFFPVFLFALEVNSEVVAGGFSAGSELIVYRGACGLGGSVRRVHCR